MKITASIRSMPKVELHQHLDGSIPPVVTWRIMKRYGLNPVPTLTGMKKLLQLQPEEEGSLLAYLDKFHFPMWVTQFYENIEQVSEAVAVAAAKDGVHTFELRYAPVIHVYAGLTIRQAIRSVMAGLRKATDKYPKLEAGLVVIAMRQHGPHVAKIIAKARGGLGLTAHAGEDADPSYIWQAIDELGCTRIGHGCSAIRDRALLRRLARDQILVECAPTSNYQTGAVKRGTRHPIYEFLEHGVPVSICTDNTTVSQTSSSQESALVAKEIGLKAVREIHRAAAAHTFIGVTESWKTTVKGRRPGAARGK